MNLFRIAVCVSKVLSGKSSSNSSSVPCSVSKVIAFAVVIDSLRVPSLLTNQMVWFPSNSNQNPVSGLIVLSYWSCDVKKLNMTGLLITYLFINGAPDRTWTCIFISDYMPTVSKTVLIQEHKVAQYGGLEPPPSRFASVRSSIELLLHCKWRDVPGTIRQSPQWQCGALSI